MKKFILIFVFVLGFLFISTKSFAQENSLISSPSSSSAEIIDYQLPYPGLLPDSPLYFFRALRDNLSGFLIADPLKKAEFDLLQSDKRLNAGIYLSDKKKYDLAESTVSKGENYLEDSISKMEQAKKQGELVSDIGKRVYLSSLKQQQVLRIIADKVSGNLREKFLLDNKRVEELGKRVKKIIPQNN